MVFQNYALFPHMSVRKNIGFGLMMRRVPRAEAQRRIDEAVALVRLHGQERQAARPALRRPAAARRHRPRHRRRAAARADGRAALEPRRQAAPRDAGGDPAHPQHLRGHDHLRDARPGGGAVARRPHRRHARRRGAPGRHARGPVRAPGPSRRRRVHGLPQPGSPAASCRSRKAAPSSMSATRASPAASASRSRTGDAAVVAIRPDDLHPVPAGNGGLVATVAASEFRGREFVGFGRTQDGIDLSFRADGRLTPGEAVHLGADPDRVLVFCGRPAVSAFVADARRAAAVAAPRRARARQPDAPRRAGRAVRPGAVHLPVPLRLLAVPAAEDRPGSRQLHALLLGQLPVRHHRHDAVAGAAGDAPQPGARRADRLPRAADEAAAPPHHHPGRADHPRHRAGGGGAAQLSRPAGLVQPHAPDTSA